VVDEAERWLRSHRGEDAFLYLHLMDPHHPYRSHTDPAVVSPDLEPLALRRRAASGAEAELLKRLYAEEVRHVDEVLAPFLAALPDDTLVVFTADHGEALGEHAAWGHGLNLYREGVRVPLMIRGPGVPRGEVGEPVQLMDLGPTVLELLGVEADVSMVGRSLLHDGPRVPLVSATFSAGPLRWGWRRGTDKVVLRMAAQPGLASVPRTAALEGTPLTAGGLYFDLAVDPHEDSPKPVPDRLLPPVGGAFAETAGAMVPGVQLMLWGRRGPVIAALEAEGSFDVIQVWGVSEMTVRREDDRLEIRCADSFPVCALAGTFETIPDAVVPLAGLAPTGEPLGPVSPDRLRRPQGDLEPGSHVWWNRRRPIVVDGYEETMERLRALGYIE
jgi:hypothetical protein